MVSSFSFGSAGGPYQINVKCKKLNHKRNNVKLKSKLFSKAFPFLSGLTELLCNGVLITPNSSSFELVCRYTADIHLYQKFNKINAS